MEALALIALAAALAFAITRIRIAKAPKFSFRFEGHFIGNPRESFTVQARNPLEAERKLPCGFETSDCKCLDDGSVFKLQRGPVYRWCLV